MSGIAGLYWGHGRRVERCDLERMTEILAHRGPNGCGIWTDGSVGLAHRMLWTTPESLRERLPFSNQDGTLAITADARLDNRTELIRQLGLTGTPADGLADSQLILHAYERWGERCPEKLLGDFAFAIWDRRTRRLFCARDHFGIKPFYYYASPLGFVFASEIKGLRCISDVPSRLNQLRVADYLASHICDGEKTFYVGVLRLLPGHLLTYDGENTTLDRYWALDPSRETRLRSSDEYAEALRAHFTEAVSCRLRSAFSVGSMLSGGIDSSSITCVAGRLRSKDRDGSWPTFSAVHETVKACNEREYVDAVLAEGEYAPYVFDVDQVSPLVDLDRSLWHQDEACYAGNLNKHWCVYGPARERGVRIVLDGFDGDSTISHGLGYLRELAVTHRWTTLTSELVSHAHLINGPWLWPLWSWIWPYELEPLISRSPVLRRTRRLVGALRGHDQTDARSSWSALLDPEFVRRTDLEDRRRSIMTRPMRTEREFHFQRLVDVGGSMAVELLDRAAAAFSIELRFPFWDKRLVEFCLSVPAAEKMQHGWTRMIMRRAMEGILPRKVQWRPGKIDHSAGFEYGLLTFERERLDDVFFHHPDVLEGYVSFDALRSAYRRLLDRVASADEVNAMWRVVSLAMWLRRSEFAP